nr:unnamed protein product [Callosobruchus chinensis]
MKSVIAALLNIMNIFGTLKMVLKKASFNTTIGMSLIELMAEYQGRSIAEFQVEHCSTTIGNNLDEMRKSVPRKVHTDQVKHFCFDRARKKAKIYKGGVAVVVETDTPCTGVSRRLFTKFKGPCRITKMNDRGPGYYERKL